MTESSTLPIKDTKEVLTLTNETAIFLIKRFKDGVGLDDMEAILQKLFVDEEFKKIMSDAITGIGNIPAEIKDIDMAEGMELATHQLAYVPKIVEAFKA